MATGMSVSSGREGEREKNASLEKSTNAGRRATPVARVFLSRERNKKGAPPSGGGPY